MSMLIDPENPFEEREEIVWAENKDIAWRLCQEMAEEDDPLTEVVNVTQDTKTPSKKGTYRFICWFRTEVTPHDSSNS